MMNSLWEPKAKGKIIEQYFNDSFCRLIYSSISLGKMGIVVHYHQNVFKTLFRGL